MKTRIYEVQTREILEPAGQLKRQTFLVDAKSREEALRFVAGKFVVDATIPSGKRIAELMGQGVKCETAEGA